MDKIDFKHWLWLDMEMTGLDPETDHIIEVAGIVTDSKFNELDSFHYLVHQPDEVLEKMKSAIWYKVDKKTGERRQVGTVFDMHMQSGVLDKVQQSGIDELIVEQRVIEFIQSHFKGRVVLAGNSIHQDRRFIKQWWPNLYQLLHYQMVDVSTLKMIARARGKKEMEKQENHTSLDDIRESMAELQFYLEKMNL